MSAFFSPWSSQFPLTGNIENQSCAEMRRGHRELRTSKVHTEFTQIWEAIAHIDSTKKERGQNWEHTHNIHSCGGGGCNTVNNNILHSCESGTKSTSWQPDKRRRRWGLWGSGGNLGGCCCGGVSQVSGVCRLGGPLHGHPIHRLPRPGQRPELWGSAGPQTD